MARTPAPTPLADADLRRIALAMAEGRAYTTSDVPQALWMAVFVPLLWMKKKDLRGFYMVVGIVGEHKTTGQAINGFPLFFSCQLLKRREAERVIAYAKDFSAQRQQLLIPKVTDGDSHPRRRTRARRAARQR